jgi:hypothetical protein
MLGTVLSAIVTVVLALTFGIVGFIGSVLARSLIIRIMQGGTFNEAFPGLWREVPLTVIVFSSLVPCAILAIGLHGAAEDEMLRALVVGFVAGAAYLFVIARARLIMLPRGAPRAV